MFDGILLIISAIVIIFLSFRVSAQSETIKLLEFRIEMNNQIIQQYEIYYQAYLRMLEADAEKKVRLT